MHPTKLLRSTVGLSQAALAEQVGTSQSTVAAYELGRKQPTWGTMERMAERVGLEAHLWFAPPMPPRDLTLYLLHAHAVDEYRAKPDRVRRRLRRELLLLGRARPSEGASIAVWEALLDGPLPTRAWTMLDPGEFGRTLRRVSPFLRVVSSQTRLIAGAAGSLSRHRPRAGE